MTRIAQELGPHAVIVESRPIRGGLLGRLVRGYEVTAVVDEGPALRAEVADLRSDVRRLLEEVVDRRQVWRARLLEEGVAREAVDHLVPQRDGGGEGAPDIQEALRVRLEELLGAPRPIVLGEGRRVVAFVGPTGAGKTTTLAKLAARFAVGEGVKVALVSADTYRLAAVEQLKAYADILGAPFAVAAYPDEMRRCLERFADVDLVLVDTGGRSHQDAMHMAELAALVAAASPDETHLVLSLSQDPKTGMSQALAFRRLGVNRVLLTKRDEAERLGLLVNLAFARVGPFSYVTTGQRVPEDIEPFSPRPFVRTLLGVGA